jgi:hypothetical protein
MYSTCYRVIKKFRLRIKNSINLLKALKLYNTVKFVVIFNSLIRNFLFVVKVC